MVADLQT